MKNRNKILAAAACAAFSSIASSQQMPSAPAELRPTAQESLLLEAMASGVQVYECTADAYATNGYQWRLKGPEAELSDRSGKSLGRHYAGPTWEALDGSKVMGEVRAQAPSADATAIPLLLLAAKSNSGSGVFASVSSVQRLDTVGGRAPATGCSAENAAKTVRVSYTATYYFYGKDKRAASY
jgi:hypothetical protein